LSDRKNSENEVIGGFSRFLRSEVWACMRVGNTITFSRGFAGIEAVRRFSVFDDGGRECVNEK
jgi:hypothetical protein